MATRAVIRENSAWLSSEFGLDYAKKIFGLTEEELAEKCGRYSRGKRKGLVRGLMQWETVVKGGWKKDGYGYMNGHVERPGRRFNFRIVIPSWGYAEEDQQILFKYER